MEPDPTTQPPAPPDPVTLPSAPRTFTQEELNSILADARRKESETAREKLLAEMGVKSPDEVKAIVEAQKAAEEAAKSELQKAQEAATRAGQEAEAAKAEAARTVALAGLREALRTAGINPERLDAAVRLADPAGLKVADGKVEGVSEQVAAVKQVSPEWFGAPGRPFSAPQTTSRDDSSSFATMTPDAQRAALAKFGVTV